VSSDRFREGCVKFARFYDRWVIREQQRRRPLDETKAVKLGAELLSEGFTLGVGVSILVYETDRTRRKDLVKKAEEAARWEGLLTRLDQLEERQRELSIEVGQLQANHHHHSLHLSGGGGKNHNHHLPSSEGNAGEVPSPSRAWSLLDWGRWWRSPPP